MKKLLFGMMACTILLASCKKEKEKIQNEENPEFYFTAKIDGVEFKADMWSCECTNAALFGTEAYIHSGTLVLRGKKNSKDVNEGEIFLRLGEIDIKTYQLESDKNGPGAYYQLGTGKWAAGGEVVPYGASNPIYSTGTGSVIITLHKDNIVEGSFDLNTISYADGTKKNITEGKFRMKYRTI
ncbi:hypothetical protein [Pseudopedobacter beijingensis]|uniref:Lipocalin-like domain-containing protein n=1 Tax=Pseudopedobacter beijingensis TaxID=1207056 RepID=A0ABW4IC79_9SPHI